MTESIFSLLPPLVAMILVIATRKVLFSLGVGSMMAALLVAEFHMGETVKILWTAIVNVFVSDGELNSWNVYIILFLLILGIITAFITISGGSRAFGEWALKRVKTRVGAQLVTGLLGIIIFIDDYFNSLAVGQISRPITDRQKISRAKLAYLIDSTSAPICVISPISSWGAYIIGIIGSIIIANNISGITAFSSFIKMIPMNFYVWASFTIILLTILRKTDLGKMRIHEEKALTTGELYDPRKTIPGELKANLPTSEKGKVGDLVWPILALVIGTIGFMFWTGIKATEGKVTILTIFENTDVATSLLYGGIIGLLVALFIFFNHVFRKRSLSINVLPLGVKEGIQSMLPAVYILIFSWVLIDLIGQVGTGTYLASIVQQSEVNIAYIPFILFLIACLMAFATGTSWGSFGILLPIAAEIAVVTDVTILLPAMAAVLAGAVFGDHCSPISDTTILSSTGAGCHLMDHVITQLPYAGLAALSSAIGYLLFALTLNILLSLVVVIAFAIVSFIILGKRNKVISE